MNRFSPTAMGIIGLVAMIIFYALVQYVFTRDPLHAYFFFKDKWFFLLPIILGFGIQMGIFQAIRKQVSKKVVAASGGISGVSMVMCCLHHTADLVPILGISGAAMFLSNYQDYFLLLSVIFMIGGILYMMVKLKGAKQMECHSV